MSESINESFPMDIYSKVKTGDTLYHVSNKKYRILSPIGIDLGNALDKPGWSLYTWNSLDLAKSMCLIRALKWIRKNYNPDMDEILYFSSGSVIVLTEGQYNWFLENIDNIDYAKGDYIHYIKITKDMQLGLGHSSATKGCITIRGCDIRPYKIEEYFPTKDDIIKYCKVISDDKYDEYVRNSKVDLINRRGLLNPLFTMDGAMINQTSNKIGRASCRERV